jgi:hypothetical protein
VEADAVGDDTQKMSARGLLQTAMIDFADKTASLDDGVIKLAGTWKVRPLTDKPLPEVKLISLTTSQSSNSQSSPQPQIGKPIDLLAQVNLPADALNGNWTKTIEGLETAGKDNDLLQLPFKVDGEYDYGEYDCFTNACLGIN